MVCTSPSSPASCNVASRAAQIVAAANAAAPLTPATVPQTLTLTPAAASNFLPGDTSHQVAATLLDGSNGPLSGFTIDVALQSGPSGTPASASGPSPTVNYTFGNTGGAGTNVIRATVAYTVPTGQKFKSPGRQGIVLAGQPQQGAIAATAEKSWINDVCGNGVVGPGEECDDGSTNPNDNCTNGCQSSRCGDGILDTAAPGVEQCDDGNTNDHDACKNNCTNNVCGGSVVKLVEM
jgi:cysteine-rich repeat protein